MFVSHLWLRIDALLWSAPDVSSVSIQIDHITKQRNAMPERNDLSHQFKLFITSIWTVSYTYTQREGVCIEKSMSCEKFQQTKNDLLCVGIQTWWLYCKAHESQMETNGQLTKFNAITHQGKHFRIFLKCEHIHQRICCICLVIFCVFRHLALAFV